MSWTNEEAVTKLAGKYDGYLKSKYDGDVLKMILRDAMLSERNRLYPILKECREYVRFNGGESGFLFRDINVALGEG